MIRLILLLRAWYFETKILQAWYECMNVKFKRSTMTEEAYAIERQERMELHAQLSKKVAQCYEDFWRGSLR